MSRKGEIKIDPFENPGGGTAWRVQGTVKGERRRRNFSGDNAQALALAEKQDWEREVMNMTPLPSVTTRLTDPQVREAEAVFLRLQGQPLSLSKAVDFALRTWRATERSSTVRAALDQFMAAKRNQNLRPRTLENLQHRLQKLAGQFPSAQVGDVQSDAIRAHVFRKGSSPINQRNDCVAFSNFFNWCVTEGYCAASPMTKIARVKVDHEEPEILTLAETRGLLHHARMFKDGALVPYVVLALFAGIRPMEIQRLTWADVDLNAKHVTISGKIAKMRGRRIVSLSENAIEWLLPYRRFPLTPTNWRKDFEALKKLAGYGHSKPWPADVLRHTGVSMHLARHEHEGKTAAWAGNSPDVVQKHYKGLVTPAQAQEFWSITPTDSTIISLNQKAA